MQKTKHPLLTIIIIILLFSGLLFGVIFLLIPKPSGVDMDDSAGTEVLEKSTYFTNYFFIQDYIGSDRQNIIFNDISNFVLSPSELASAKSPNNTTVETENIYTVDTDINSYQELEPYPTISLILNISDQRKYKLYLYTDTDFQGKYVAVALKNLDTNKSALYVNSEKDSYNDMLKQWGKTILNTSDFEFIFSPI